MKINIKIFTSSLLVAFSIMLTNCNMDIKNPNGPTDAQILNTRDGLITLSVGLRQNYSTAGLGALILTPGTTSREIKGITTFTNITEIEAGGTSLPTFNGNILGVWLRMYRVIGIADDIITNAPSALASDAAMRSGVVAHAHLFKAMALGGLATSFEKLPLQTDKLGAATFSERSEALKLAVKLLDDAAALVASTAPSTEFRTKVTGADFDLINTIQAYRARYNMMLGNYDAALSAANAVDLTKKSSFVYTTQSQNPIFTATQISQDYNPRENYGLPIALVDVADKRLAFYLSTPDKVVAGEKLKKLVGFFDAIDRAIPAYLPDEMRLIRAEANLRKATPDIAAALTDINAVRTQTSGDAFGVNAGLPAYAGEQTKEGLLTEVYKQRCAELFMTGLRFEDSRRFGRPAPPTSLAERSRNFYPYPDQERLTNPNTPTDPTN
jgi:starch-binding outer membrane protein, SusD/RagB family